MAQSFTNQYLPPGVYVSQGVLPNTTIIGDVPRALCIIGPGSKTIKAENVAVRRGYVYRELLSFTASGGYPHVADLDYTSDQLKSTCTLESYDGTNYVELNEKWYDFIDSDTIYVKSEVYSSAKTYYFSYQSTNKLTDYLPIPGGDVDAIPDIRDVLKVGDKPGTLRYTRWTDYNINITYGTITAGTANTGDGLVAWDSTKDYTALEPRTYTITMASSGATGVATFNWYGDTPSSGADDNITTGATVELEDGVVLSFTTGTFDAGDTYTFTVRNSGELIWGISQAFSETKTTGDVYRDYSGTITGTGNTYYTILTHIPEAGTLTCSGSGGAGITITQYGSTSYAYFASDPSANFPLTIEYTWAGNQPSYGNTYYVNYKYAKESTDYNVPKLVYNETELYAYVGEPTSDNLLALAGQVAFLQGLPWLYIVQIEDSDGDDIYNNNDYIAGLTASSDKYDITDIVMTDSNDVLVAAMRNNIEDNSSSYAKKYRMGWFWMPIGTDAGDTSTSGTLVYEAAISMQVPADSPARGRFVLIGNTWAEREYVLEDGEYAVLTTSAWALATALAAKQNTFTSPSQTLLRGEIVGFSDIEDYGATEKEYLSANGVLCLEKLGSLIRTFDTTTPHNDADDTNEPSATCQKDVVTKTIEKALDSKVIALVPQSTADAIAYIRAEVALQLNALVANGTIAPYEDSNGNPRQLNPYSDIYVERLTGSRTSFSFKYFYFLKYPIKRIFGTYYVDENVIFGSGGTPTISNT